MLLINNDKKYNKLNSTRRYKKFIHTTSIKVLVDLGNIITRFILATRSNPIESS